MEQTTLLLKELRFILQAFIKKHGMDNGYETSFKGKITDLDKDNITIHSSIDLTLPHSDNKTFKEVKELGNELYKLLYAKCIEYRIKYPKMFDVESSIKIYSQHIEYGCFKHYIELRQSITV